MATEIRNIKRRAWYALAALVGMIATFLIGGISTKSEHIGETPRANADSPTSCDSCETCTTCETCSGCGGCFES